MDAMGPDDRAKIAKPKKPRHGHALVDEAIVHDDVRDSERAHPEADAEGDLAGDPWRATATVENQRDGDRSVKQRERVVGFESVTFPSRLVVRSMDVPKPGVPDAAMKKRGPEVHRHGDDRRDSRPDDCMNEDVVHGAALPRTR
jgi:hypothetical protein